jgi:hypothetical protein
MTKVEKDSFVTAHALRSHWTASAGSRMGASRFA